MRVPALTRSAPFGATARLGRCPLAPGRNRSRSRRPRRLRAGGCRWRTRRATSTGGCAPSTPSGKSRSSATSPAAIADPARGTSDRRSSRPTRRSISYARWRSSASGRSRSSAERRTCATTGPRSPVPSATTACSARSRPAGAASPPERAKAARAAGVQSVSVSIDGLRETHDMLRGVRGSFDAAMAAMGNLREAGIPISANTQINRFSLVELESIFEALVPERIHGWQVQLTVAMGRAADERGLLLEPYQMLEADAPAGAHQAAGRVARNTHLAGQQHRLLRPARERPSRALRRSPQRLVRRGALDARHRGERRHQGLPVAPVGGLRRRQHPRRLAPRHLGARRASPLHARADGGRSLGLLPELLLRRRLPRRVLVDDARPLRPDGQ